MGPVVGNSDWKEQAEGWLCTIPDTFNASFVSPAFAASVPGGDGDGVRDIRKNSYLLSGGRASSWSSTAKLNIVPTMETKHE